MNNLKKTIVKKLSNQCTYADSDFDIKVKRDKKDPTILKTTISCDNPDNPLYQHILKYNNEG